LEFIKNLEQWALSWVIPPGQGGKGGRQCLLFSIYLSKHVPNLYRFVFKQVGSESETTEKKQAENFVEWKPPFQRKRSFPSEFPIFRIRQFCALTLRESDSPVDINYNPVIW
jgi:hypothetical protein